MRKYTITLDDDALESMVGNHHNCHGVGEDVYEQLVGHLGARAGWSAVETPVPLGGWTKTMSWISAHVHFPRRPLTLTKPGVKKPKTLEEQTAKSKAYHAARKADPWFVKRAWTLAWGDLIISYVDARRSDIPDFELVNSVLDGARLEDGHLILQKQGFQPEGEDFIYSAWHPTGLLKVPLQ